VSALTVATDVFNLFTVTAFLAAVLFIINYSRRADWWRYSIGRTVVSFDVTIIVTLLPRVIRLLFGFSASSLFYVWYSAAALAVVTGVALWRTAVINRVQNEADNDPPPPIPVVVPLIEENNA
jgi:hypothetical protein